MKNYGMEKLRQREYWVKYRIKTKQMEELQKAVLADFLVFHKH